MNSMFWIGGLLGAAAMLSFLCGSWYMLGGPYHIAYLLLGCGGGLLAAVLIFISFALPLWYFYQRLFKSTKQTLKVCIPICRQCRKAGEPEPQHVDFDNYWMAFLCHRAFAEALHK